MKKCININLLLFMFLAFSFSSCKKDYGNLNNPTVEDFLNNATKSQLNNLVSGTESALRNSLGFYLDDVSIVGREIYRYSTSDPRYYTDLLGANDAELQGTGFYIINVWASRYRVVKNCNLLIDAANKSTLLTDAEKKGYTGFAKTIKAYQLLLTLNLTNANGIRIDVSNPDQLGPVVGYDESLTAIASLLDEGRTDFEGAQVSFPLSSGFAGLNDAAGLTKVNRALAARVAVYRQQWPAALSALNNSFFDIDANFNTGVFNVFGTGSGDQLNPAFFPQNSNGEARASHPSYAADIAANDDRINKAPLRNSLISNSGLTSDRDVWVYTTSTAPVPIIRNEELILIYAEANIQNNTLGNAVTAINKIRNSHGLVDYSGAVTQAALITEMLKQRRYSLFFEGHRWVDLRRYNLLNTLPVDRTGDDVWSSFPLPSTE
ncbi:MAG: RagB/SusD family nutrient uptake outer membrane protein [Bacteroidota bacterium]